MIGRFARGMLGFLAAAVVLLLLLSAALAVHVWLAARGSLPLLEGEATIPGLAAPVRVARDAAGVPTVFGNSREDVAAALGFLHAQERFFQMDLLRRTAAGELGELLGGLALPLDRTVRVHRFRARARAILRRMTAEEQGLLRAYAAGVNAGLAALARRPWEHALLLAAPAAWRPEDTILVVFAMYLSLQPATPQREMDRARAAARGGWPLADLLYPDGAPNDAALDGSRLPEPPLPAALTPLVPAAAPGRARPVIAPAIGPMAPAEDAAGSNSWAVAGAHTAWGGALLANDMHLGLRLPNTWYRARLVVRPAPKSDAPALDIVGATLPGTPLMVVGANGAVAWGFTNSYIDTADAVIVEEAGAPGLYRTPAGARPVRIIEERVCGRLRCETLRVRETVWGPVIGQDALGRTLAMRWTAHAPDAVRLAPALRLERATSVEDVLALARASAIPQQNLIAADRTGRIGWTIIGQVPDRFGYDGRDAASFADGTRGWRGMLAPSAVPAILDPPDGRLWTANARVLGGEAHARLGNGGADHGGRAGRIRDLLASRARFAPGDFLAIQLDDLSTVHLWWRDLLAAELAARSADPALAAMRAPVAGWDGRMRPESVGARLVSRFRELVRDRIYAGYMGGKPDQPFRRTFAPSNAEGPLRRLLTARPPGLVPPGHAGWTGVLDAALADLAREVEEEASGDVARFTWGAVNRAGVRHPLAQVLLPLRAWTDPPDAPVPGGRNTVRATAPGFGASQRLAVAPGREDEGLWHMPGGQAGNPLSPYYLAGHGDWLEGRPAPLLPGPARWRLALLPRAGPATGAP